MPSSAPPPLPSGKTRGIPLGRMGRTREAKAAFRRVALRAWCGEAKQAG
ncbi:MAG: hypothetical protein ACPHIA_00620 [Alphaproteobacteria bacterium]